MWSFVSTLCCYYCGVCILLHGIIVMQTSIIFTFLKKYLNIDLFVSCRCNVTLYYSVMRMD
jgi:hypothetical protein